MDTILNFLRSVNLYDPTAYIPAQVNLRWLPADPKYGLGFVVNQMIFIGPLDAGNAAFPTIQDAIDYYESGAVASLVSSIGTTYAPETFVAGEVFMFNADVVHAQLVDALSRIEALETLTADQAVTITDLIGRVEALELI